MKKCSSRLFPALLTATALTAPYMARAQVSTAGGATVYEAPNGVPIVDIVNPNADGLSHNKFHQYNVDPRGLIHAETGMQGSADLSLVKTTTTKDQTYSNTGSASGIKAGGNMAINSNNDVTIRGSNVEAGGDVDVNAKNVNITTSQDIHETTSSTTTTSVGWHTSTDNNAGARADASAEADAGGASATGKAGMTGIGGGVNAGEASASAQAGASADASTDNKLDLVRHNEETSKTTSVTNQASGIKSGGNMNINAQDKLNVHGSDIEAGGDVNLKAKDMSFTAAEDVTVTTTTSSSTATGFYAEGSASAGAKAEAGGAVRDAGVSADASAEASADLGIGLYGTNTTGSSMEGSSTARTSTIKSGGNMTREAEGKITDVGTQIEAGGDFTQKATEWESKAAQDRTFSSSESESNAAKFGAYGEASAGVSGNASAGVEGFGVENDNGVDASAGLKASYNRETEAGSSSSSKAVVSNIKSGGTMNTTTTGATTLEGTNLESGGDMNLNAGSLDYRAAQDTETQSSESSTIDAEMKAGVDVKKKVTGSIAGGYEAGSETSRSTTAVTGSMKSGGNLNVNTKGDARFEGTNLEAEGDAGIKAGGNVTFDAARDTSETTTSGENASASLSASKSAKSGKGMGLQAEGGFEEGREQSSDAVTGSVKAGGKVDISAGGNARFEGTELQAGEDMSIEAGGNVDFEAAKSTSSSENYGLDVSIDASQGGKDAQGKSTGKSMGATVGGNYGMSDETTAQESNLGAGGNIKIKAGNDANFEGTNIESGGKTAIGAGGDVNFKAKTESSTSVDVSGEVGLGKTSGSSTAEDNGSSVGVSADVKGGTSTTRTGGSIKAGEIEIESGGDARFEGARLDSEGDASVKAKGDVRFDAAESSSIDGSFSGSVGTDGAVLKDAGIGGGVARDGGEINAGGNLNIESGGTTSFTGTTGEVGGEANVKAQKVEKNTAVGGGGQIGTSRMGAEIEVQQTDIKARGGNLND